MRGGNLSPAAPKWTLSRLRPQPNEPVHVALPRPRLAVLQPRRGDAKRAARARARGPYHLRARGICRDLALSFGARLSLRRFAARAPRAADLQLHRQLRVRPFPYGAAAAVRAYCGNEEMRCASGNGLMLRSRTK